MQRLKNERTVLMAKQLPSRPLSHQLISPETDSEEAVKKILKVIVIQLLYQTAVQQKMAYKTRAL
jgi:hypothetical protein